MQHPPTDPRITVGSVVRWRNPSPDEADERMLVVEAHITDIDDDGIPRVVTEPLDWDRDRWPLVPLMGCPAWEVELAD